MQDALLFDEAECQPFVDHFVGAVEGKMIGTKPQFVAIGRFDGLMDEITDHSVGL